MGQFEKHLYLIMNLIAVNAGFFVTIGMLDGVEIATATTGLRFLVVASNLLVLIISLSTGSVARSRRKSNSAVVKSLVKQWLIYAVGMIILFVTLRMKNDHLVVLGIASSLYLMFHLVLLTLFNAFIKEYRRQGFNHKRILVIGQDSMTQEFIQEIQLNPHYGFKLIGVYGEEVLKDGVLINKSDGDIYQFISKHKVDEVYLNVNSLKGDCERLLLYCDMKNVQVRMLDRMISELQELKRNIGLDRSGGIPIITLENRSESMRLARYAKRAFDVAFSVFVIMTVCSWLFPLVALLIKLSSRGSIFFVQERTGYNGQTFKCFKFRTMFVNDSADSQQATMNDPRITTIGKFLRATDIDELPQFFNVLLGHMSIVGPRPHMLFHTQEYSQKVTSYMHRHWIKPGITGLAQIKGFRGDTRKPGSLEGRLKWDRVYIENSDLLLDTRIVLRTAMNAVLWENRGS